MGDISKYMAIIYAGLLVTCAYNAFSAVLRALGDSRSPLYFLIVSAVLNVVLDIGFIVLFHMGVEGCAYATVIAQGVSAVLCLIYIIKKFDVLRLRKRDFKFSFFIIRKLLALGVPMGCSFPSQPSALLSSRAPLMCTGRCLWRDFRQPARSRI